jgi:hypothetical protein
VSVCRNHYTGLLLYPKRLGTNSSNSSGLNKNERSFQNANRGVLKRPHLSEKHVGGIRISLFFSGLATAPCLPTGTWLATHHRTMSLIRSGAIALFLTAGGASLHAQGSPNILHEPVDCVGPGEYLIVDATIEPSSEIRGAKVYFRSDKYPKFYFVEMTPEGATFSAVLPKPSAETQHIIYYIEALDRGFNNTLSAELTTAVKDPCEERDPGAVFPGEDPGIVVGATESGASVFPPGFGTVGIVGTLSSAGLLSSVGGGPGVGTVVAIGGAAAGAGGLAAAATGSEESTTTTATEARPTTTTTTASPTTVPGTTTTTAAPAGPNSTTTTTPGPSTTTVVTTTTAPPSTTTTPATLTACFTISDADGAAGCQVNFDASCSTGDIVDYRWRFQDNPPATVSGPSPTASYDWSSDPACGGPFTRLVRLTVTASDNRTAETQSNINPNNASFMAMAQAPAQSLQSSFTSFLMLPASQGRLESHVSINGEQLEVTDNAAPYTHRMNGRRDWNIVEGYLTSQSAPPVLWRFDFAASAHFIPGSIRVQTGVVVSRDAQSIVFRLSGAPGERVVFQYRLLP